MRHVDLLNIVIHGQDDLRKRRIAVILAWGIFALAVLSLLTLIFYSEPGGLLQESNFTDQDFVTLFWGTLLTLTFSSAFLLLTRTKIPAGILGSILVIGTSAILFTSDSPIELVSGPSTTLLLFPVFMSGVLIHSSAALLVAVMLLIPFILIPGNMVDVNFYAWGSVMGLALVIWVACYVMEKAIREAREEAYRSNAMLGIASHELRTPLGVILGNLSILKLQNGGGQSSPVTEIMEKSAHSLNETVSRLLDQAYVQSGKAQLQTSEVNVGDLVQEVADPIQSLAKQKLLDFSVSISDSLPKNVGSG